MSARGYIEAIEDPRRRADGLALLELMAEATGEEPHLWGTSIVGFGTHRYAYASGREGDTAAVGFSPRKQALTIYGLVFYEDRPEELDRLGPHKLGKGCVYVKRLEDLDLALLRRMVGEAHAARSNTT